MVAKAETLRKELMRSIEPFVIVLLAIVTAACDDQVKQTHRGARYDYKLTLPASFVRSEVSGIDSKVEEFRSNDVIISTDFGFYSGPPKCSRANKSCSIHQEQIAGRKSIVATFEHGIDERPNEPKPFKVFVHVQIVEQQDLDLNMFARCDTKKACLDTLSYFRRVKLIQLADRPAEFLPPRPSPPKAH